LKIISPIGEYEFHVDRVSLRDGRVEVAGRLGEWETTTVIERADMMALAARAAPPIAAAFALCLLARRLKRARSRDPARIADPRPPHPSSR
jgi:hypothetical protein